MQKQIVCMKWGAKYTPDYVNILYKMVSRNLNSTFRFVCLTDDAAGIRPEVECIPCPEIQIPESKKNLPWRKISLWNGRLEQMTGDWLFLDLDVVVTSDLSPFFEWEPESSFVVMKNETQPKQGIGNTSVFRFKVGSHPYLYRNLIENPEGIFGKYSNSQTYVSKEISHLTWWPDQWCRLFKVHCVPPMPSRWWTDPELPRAAKIVAFPGSPNPPEAMEGKWPCKWYKKIYKSIRPAKWVREHWTEEDSTP